MVSHSGMLLPYKCFMNRDIGIFQDNDTHALNKPNSMTYLSSLLKQNSSHTRQKR